MTRLLFLISLSLMLGLALTAAAQDGDSIGNGNGVCQFIDEDGDGFNDLAPDADGDGIPNGMDPDYVPAEDCDGEGNAYAHQGEGQTGNMYRKGQAGDVDSLLAGDGAAVAFKAEGLGQGNAHGPGDGTGGGVAPGDGTGFGPGDGTGDCDGTGNPADAVQQRRGGRR